MEFKSHWITENFFRDAQVMRQRIDDHFDDALAKKLDFSKRTIWNYWHIDKLYTYLRANPDSVFPVLYQRFLTQLQEFCASNYGLEARRSYLSMYVNGCGQNIHNDAKNGRMAYVYSLTRWNERHFDGGETIIYKLGDKVHANIFSPSAGKDFYDMIAPQFNRLLLFDDRMPHAVRPISGTMNPSDARFVMHGHIMEPQQIAHVEGGLQGADLMTQWQQMSEPVAAMLQSHEQNGFITVEIVLSEMSTRHEINIKHAQLLPMSAKAKSIDLCLDDAREILSHITWPVTEHFSRLVCALCSVPLKD